jgi:hypothetical protein
MVGFGAIENVFEQIADRGRQYVQHGPRGEIFTAKNMGTTIILNLHDAYASGHLYNTRKQHDDAAR